MLFHHKEGILFQNMVILQGVA